MVISPNSFTASTYCDPVANGEACIYYLTVLSKQSTEAVTFSINAEAPGDVGVISCDSSAPDGLRDARTITIPLSSTRGSKYYEVCSNGVTGTAAESVVVSVGQ